MKKQKSCAPKENKYSAGGKTNIDMRKVGRGMAKVDNQKRPMRVVKKLGGDMAANNAKTVPGGKEKSFTIKPAVEKPIQRTQTLRVKGTANTTRGFNYSKDSL